MNFQDLEPCIQRDIDCILPLLQPINPKAIILGGSYSTGEQCRIVHRDKLHYLSDFDLFIVCESKLSETANNQLYNSIISLSETFKQHNPYFHIGLKFRTSSELQQESQSIYYWELLTNGIYLNDSSLRLPQFSPSIFDQIGKPETKELNDYLFKCATTRLWCNILFFPTSLITEPDNPSLNLWYSYFLSRGAMDWIMFRLLKNGIWKSTYSSRFEILNSCENINFYNLSLLEKLYEIRLGQQITRYQDIVEDVLELSLLELDNYINTISPMQTIEVKFLTNMSFALISLIRNDDAIESLKLASGLFTQLTSKDYDITNTSNPSLFWERLRREYSDFRLNRSNKDKFDHQVNTDRFLTLGN